MICIVIVVTGIYLIAKPKIVKLEVVKEGIKTNVSNAKTKDGEYCFRKVENKDVTDVTLSINGNTVTGKMDWVPFEKDSARGTLSGSLMQNGEMNLIYNYMIEGSNQTETKIMKIENGKLYIKHGELVDPKYNGNLSYKDVSKAVYNEIIEACAL